MYILHISKEKTSYKEIVKKIKLKCVYLLISIEKMRYELVYNHIIPYETI